ncbi:hypothetical protein IMSAGC018_02260 [Lachnospiraceae bacterium]|nr:hypothetical protein IMSAGC018_02260 [Lachnospiraceae bacterium]
MKHNFERDCEYGKHVFEVGKYCIQFNTFLNNQIGLQVLRDWKENCLKWCYHRLEDGKLGDQKYPDKWRQRYEGIYESRNLGAGVAPWNLHLFTYISSRNREIWMKSKAKIFKVVFYHFEGMKYLGRDDICLNIWNPCVEKTGKKIKILYGEYLREIRDIRTFLDKKYGVTFEHMLISKDIFLEKDYSLMQFCKDDGIIDGLKKWMKYRKYNIVRINKIT